MLSLIKQNKSDIDLMKTGHNTCREDVLDRISELKSDLKILVIKVSIIVGGILTLVSLFGKYLFDKLFGAHL